MIMLLDLLLEASLGDDLKAATTDVRKPTAPKSHYFWGPFFLAFF
jgi:hypothetical protein